MTWLWNGIKIPEKWCFRDGKQCTPDCSSYDLGWLYLTDEGEKEEVTEVIK